MKLTAEFERVLRLLSENPESKHWGYDLMKAADLKSGTLYPMLSRMESRGYLVSAWEDAGNHRSGPRRKYYVLTELGKDFGTKTRP